MVFIVTFALVETFATFTEGRRALKATKSVPEIKKSRVVEAHMI